MNNEIRLPVNVFVDNPENEDEPIELEVDQVDVDDNAIWVYCK